MEGGANKDLQNGYVQANPFYTTVYKKQNCTSHQLVQFLKPV